MNGPVQELREMPSLLVTVRRRINRKSWRVHVTLIEIGKAERLAMAECISFSKIATLLIPLWQDIAAIRGWRFKLVGLRAKSSITLMERR